MELNHCPLCGGELQVVRETNWDNLDTYLYPVCKKCGWTTKEVFYNTDSIAEHIKNAGRKKWQNRRVNNG